MAEPWQSALEVLEEYTQAMKYTSFSDCEEVCFLHASRLAQAVQRLPHNAPSRLLPGDASGGGIEQPPETKELPDVLPKTAPAMVQALLKNLEPTWRTEVGSDGINSMPWPCHAQALLAPEPFAATAQKGAVLVAAEALASELGGLLQSAPSWSVRQQGEWALCSSMERFSAFLRWLTSIVISTTSELDDSSVSSSTEDFSASLRSVARLVSRMSGYMQGALGSLDPARPVSARMGSAAEGLDQAADELFQKALRLLHAEALAKGERPGADAAAHGTPEVRFRNHHRRSMMGKRRSILAILAGHPEWQLPHEVRRQEGLHEHLQEQREAVSSPSSVNRPTDAVVEAPARRSLQAPAFEALDMGKDGVVSMDG
ncbi:unnamed protein product [Cladocopium goreaui]|uniref:Histidine--tRNA ligase n=1 Tax=Cladocopium goreaui TaxID=2562237 RepID=A0A9P1BPB3_9DINO|nr:unnamed protein product [Cladocopium goreaui]